MRPVFCGNFDYDTRQYDLERLFSKYGRVDRVDIKSGFAFVYFEDEADARDAIRGLDGIPFGYGRRRLSVEWARGDRGPRSREGSRSAPGMRPTKTLFVINFDPINTRVRDLEKHFEPYGKINNVRIRRNFAFIQFETQEDATNALEHTNMSKIMDRQVSVEYALRDDDERGNRPISDGYDRARSPSPDRYRGRPSPDYGRRLSPDYGRRLSPDYGRNYSPEPLRYRSRSPMRRRSRS